MTATGAVRPRLVGFRAETPPVCGMMPRAVSHRRRQLYFVSFMNSTTSTESLGE